MFGCDKCVFVKVFSLCFVIRDELCIHCPDTGGQETSIQFTNTVKHAPPTLFPAQKKISPRIYQNQFTAIITSVNSSPTARTLLSVAAEPLE